MKQSREKKTPVDVHSEGRMSSSSPKPSENPRVGPSVEVGVAQPLTYTLPAGKNSVWECDWEEAYARCPVWKEKWEATKQVSNVGGGATGLALAIGHSPVPVRGFGSGLRFRGSRTPEYPHFPPWGWGISPGAPEGS